MSNMAYLSELFADSLLTGVPEITMTKSIPRKIFKIIVLFACIGGFIYQAAEFLGIFFEYPTNVDVGMAFPARVDTPAITICNKNGSVLYCRKFLYCVCCLLIYFKSKASIIIALNEARHSSIS
ncbi:hypothetical protein LAZ67_22000056 [Cordylochernes scorpioides]|uniref:Uncharacterized protein n=1 Tax=Cordylochernes scorpioides TaxID=51811 RepID=A0ABY6LSV5_9ARAC|nr:hypothetical protein LAZ67_22000056 [Cordylochernes scorpioides]